MFTAEQWQKRVRLEKYRRSENPGLRESPLACPNHVALPAPSTHAQTRGREAHGHGHRFPRLLLNKSVPRAQPRVTVGPRRLLSTLLHGSLPRVSSAHDLCACVPPAARDTVPRGEGVCQDRRCPCPLLPGVVGPGADSSAPPTPQGPRGEEPAPYRWPGA